MESVTGRVSDTGRVGDKGASVTGRVGGAEQDYSLSKARVKHDGAWSPNGWLTVTC